MSQRALPLVASLALLVACSAGGGNSGGGYGVGASSGSTAGGAGSGGGGGTSSGGGGTGAIVIVPPAGGSAGDDGCSSVLQVTYRDFDNKTHPDFEMVDAEGKPFGGDVVRRGLVEPQLGADHKPVFKSGVGCPWDGNDPNPTPLGCANWSVSQPEIQSKESFDQWYRDTPGINQTFVKELQLTDDGTGVYGYASSAFFPLAPDEGWGITPPTYLNQNFLFTTEIHLTFKYEASKVFSFKGDDDLWVFINGKLALDLGGMHGEAEGTIDFDAQAADLGIKPNGVYSMDVFHAERHTTGSNFKIETTIGCFTNVIIR